MGIFIGSYLILFVGTDFWVCLRIRSCKKGRRAWIMSFIVSKSFNMGLVGEEQDAGKNVTLKTHSNGV